MEPAEQYFSIAEAAELLKVKPGAIRARIKRGKLKVHEVVGKQAITLAQLNELRVKGFRKRRRKPSN